MKFVLAAFFLPATLIYSQIQLPPLKGSLPGNADPNVPAVTGKSTISGVVINGKTHEPIKKANVMINGPASLSAITDGGGNFSFRALPAGTYWVMANQADFTNRSPRHQMATNITLTDGEEKTSVEIALEPGGSVSGKVLNEDDQPVPGCSITAIGGDKKESFGGATDSEGIYHIHGMSAGRYSLRAKCGQSFPAPHGFMRLNDPDIPTEGYGPASYGGDGNSQSAGLPVEAGAELDGIDFHVLRSRMFAVRANVTGVDASLLPIVQMFMTAKDNSQDDDVGMLARYNGRSGMYVFRNVAGGSYEITALVFRDDKAYQARQDVQVGHTQVTDVELRMAAGPTISGSVVTDDPNIQLEGQQISMLPLQFNRRGPTPQATITKEGTFEFKSMLPGRFSLNGLQGGFFKTVTLSGREINPSDFEITGEGAGILHIALSSHFGKVHVSAESQPEAAEQVAAALLPVDGGQPLINISPSRPVDVEFSAVPPGKYRVLLMSADNPWAIVNDPGAQKALADRTSPVTVTESGEQRVTAGIVGQGELSKLLDSIE